MAEQCRSRRAERASVLIIEDHAGMREATGALLEAEGFEVILLENGNQAAEAFRSQPAAVVLCDMHMPGKKGVETIEELCREFPGVKIIAMSGGGMTDRGVDVLTTAKHHGASEVLMKPFTGAALLAAVNQMLD